MVMDWTRKCPENRPSWNSSSREWGWDIPLTPSAPRTRPITTPASTGTVCSPTHRPDRRWGTRFTWIRCPPHLTIPLQDTRSPCLRIRVPLPPGMVSNPKYTYHVYSEISCKCQTSISHITNYYGFSSYDKLDQTRTVNAFFLSTSFFFYEINL